MKPSNTQNPVSTNKEDREKKVNPTWEAMGRYQGAFTYIAPEFQL